MNMESLIPGHVYGFEYRNHKGEVANRRVQFEDMAFGIVEPYYLDTTLLFVGYDLDKQATRSFDVSKIVGKTFQRISR